MNKCEEKRSMSKKEGGKEVKEMRQKKTLRGEDYGKRGTGREM